MNSFNSKILLFGEYTILNDSMALAIPFSEFSGHLVLPSDGDIPNPISIESNQSIKRWAKYLSEQKGFNCPPNEQKLLTDALMGLYFDSNIPQGYGVGSSGALTAAVYSRYFIDSTNYQRNSTISLEELKADLSLMETYFHGNSSGIDPLVSYLDEPILIKKGMVFKQPLALPKDLKIFLIDTGSPASTGNLMEQFHIKRETPTLKPEFTKMSSLTDSIIEAFCNNSISFAMIEELSTLQHTILNEMFVTNQTIENALHQFSGSLCVKLCGSGGGGFLLGFAKTRQFSTITNYFSEHSIPLIDIHIK
ncbi:MAG: hypothetical protein WCX31_08035 [Salinivirgaceae bacterium]|jgi:mevalonate kinase